MNNQKKKMMAEFEEEKERIVKNFKSEQEKQETTLKRSNEELQQLIAKLKIEHMNSMEELRRRSNSEVRET